MSLRQLPPEEYQRTSKHMLAQVLPCALAPCIYVLLFSPADAPAAPAPADTATAPAPADTATAEPADVPNAVPADAPTADAPKYYKFGRSTRVLDRIRRHFYKHQFYAVVGCWNVAHASLCEQNIKLLAKHNNHLVTRFGESEMLYVGRQALEQYLDIIRRASAGEPAVVSTAPTRSGAGAYACAGCNKWFKDNYALDLHKNRKTPCGAPATAATAPSTESTAPTPPTAQPTAPAAPAPPAKTRAAKQRFECESCGKRFKDNQALSRHKNRKTPCITHDIPAGDENNPLRCAWCNRTFSNTGNLNRHLTTCKIVGITCRIARMPHHTPRANTAPGLR